MRARSWLWWAKLAAVGGLAWATIGCTSYRALTPPPPSRVAEVNNSEDTIRVSVGVALAFKCTTAGANPCAKGQGSIEDTKIARILPAYVNRLERYHDGSFSPTGYVVVGVSPGETVLRIEGEDPLRVIVVE